MNKSINKLLKELDLEPKGQYENNFYIIYLQDSNEYAKMLTLLEKNATATEFPNFGKNKSNNTVTISTYFEKTVNNIDYNIFLLADFDKDEYKIKIGEVDVN